MIAIIGLEYGGLIIMSSPTLVKMGDLSSTPVLLTMLGFIVTGILLVRHVKGAILIGMLVTAAAALFTGTIQYHGVFASPPSIAPTMFQLDFRGSASVPRPDRHYFYFLYSRSVRLGRHPGRRVQPGRLSAQGRQPAARAAGPVRRCSRHGRGSLLGTSTLTAYIESSAGIAAGARTGLANVFTAALFLLALFFSPLMEMVASAVTVDYTVFFSPAFPGSQAHHEPLPGAGPGAAGGRRLHDERHKKHQVGRHERGPACLSRHDHHAPELLHHRGHRLRLYLLHDFEGRTGQARRIHWIVYAVSALFVIRYAWLGM